MDKEDCLKEAIEITKEYARGGGVEPAAVFESVYLKLVALSPDAVRGE